MEKIIIAVDLGHFRAFRVTDNEYESHRIELLESYDSLEAHGKLSDKLSDSSGRFGMGGGKSGSAKGYGEPHNMTTEIEKRAARLIAQDINFIIRKEGSPKWGLAASKTVNSRIIEDLSPDVKSQLERNIVSDLTNTPKSEILRRFI